MTAIELYTMSIPEARLSEHLAVRAEEAGWDGITFTDSQNLVGDPFVGLALAARATTRLRLMTAVSNVATRHPAALATAIATVQEESGGRAVLGVGRGDTALFHLGRPPMPLNEFFARCTDVRTYLHRGTVDIDGFPSRLRWLDRAGQPPVPLDIAASGPKVLAFAGRAAERVSLAVGADAARVEWAAELVRAAARDAGRDSPSIGAYVTVACHPDKAAGRELVRGSVAAFAHFSAMPGSTGAGVGDADRALVAEVGRTYDSHQHLVNAAPHARVLPDEFVDRFAIVGDARACTHQLAALAALGLDRLIITGPSFGADRDHSRTHAQLIREEVLPALR
jgi:5,10-methylenetetrahydromethanopterin reductase